ncbi:MAG: PQQ-binding-like beta-propeller repeat protein, partial [Pirellulaceae bacterium]
MIARFLPRVLISSSAWLLALPLAVVAAEFEQERLANWHQWRGPLANGVAPQGDPPTTWSESSHVKWKVAVPGKGKSTPIVWQDRVYLLSAEATSEVVASAARPEDQPERPFGIKFPNTKYRYLVICLDRATGRTLWTQVATVDLPHEGHHGDNSFASASPTTDGEYLYVSFGSRGLYCYDLAGQLQWSRKLDNVTTRLSFGEACSPVVHGHTLIMNRDNDSKSQILALDTRTGETRWTADRDEISAWATPLIIEQGGRTQVVTSASNRVRSYDLATGEVLWQCGGQVSNVIPCPVQLGEMVICASGYKGSVAMALPLSARGDITDSAQIAWRYDRDTPYVPSPLLYGDLLYFNKSNSGILTCLDAHTG